MDAATGIFGFGFVPNSSRRPFLYAKADTGGGPICAVIGPFLRMTGAGRLHPRKNCFKMRKRSAFFEGAEYNLPLAMRVILIRE